MWIWKQRDGELWRADDTGAPETKVSDGYSGHSDGRDNPAMQAVHNVGPIPQGTYTIGDVRDTQTHGPCVMPLAMVAGESFGRAGFLIHGDNSRHDASQGCIILPRTVRMEIAASADRMLKVAG